NSAAENHRRPVAGSPGHLAAVRTPAVRPRAELPRMAGAVSGPGPELAVPGAHRGREDRAAHRPEWQAASLPTRFDFGWTRSRYLCSHSRERISDFSRCLRRGIAHAERAVS